MKISVSQSYIRPGVYFPFCTQMQVWMAKELSSLAKDFEKFEKKYGAGFELSIYLSAEVDTTDNVIKGPAVYRKSRDVEYFIFVPYDIIITTIAGPRGALKYLLDGIHRVFELAGIDPGPLDERRESIIEHICSDPEMLDGPWPTRSGVEPPSTQVITEEEANLAVLDRAAEEWDISQPMNVEFAIDVPDDAAAEKVAKLATQRGYSTWIPEKEEDAEEESTCFCTKQMVPTQDAIAAVQRELEQLSAPFGGRVDDWSLSRP